MSAEKSPRAGTGDPPKFVFKNIVNSRFRAATNKFGSRTDFSSLITSLIAFGRSSERFRTRQNVSERVRTPISDVSERN